MNVNNEYGIKYMVYHKKRNEIIASTCKNELVILDSHTYMLLKHMDMYSQNLTCIQDLVINDNDNVLYVIDAFYIIYEFHYMDKVEKWVLVQKHKYNSTAATVTTTTTRINFYNNKWINLYYNILLMFTSPLLITKIHMNQLNECAYVLYLNKLYFVNDKKCIVLDTCDVYQFYILNQYLFICTDQCIKIYMFFNQTELQYINQINTWNYHCNLLFCNNDNNNNNGAITCTCSTYSCIYKFEFTV